MKKPILLMLICILLPLGAQSQGKYDMYVNIEFELDGYNSCRSDFDKLSVLVFNAPVIAMGIYVKDNFSLEFGIGFSYIWANADMFSYDYNEVNHFKLPPARVGLNFNIRANNFFPITDRLLFSLKSNVAFKIYSKISIANEDQKDWYDMNLNLLDVRVTPTINWLSKSKSSMLSLSLCNLSMRYWYNDWDERITIFRAGLNWHSIAVGFYIFF